MSKDENDLIREERISEALLDTVRFERLLSTAEQLCLSEPPVYPEYKATENVQADVVTRLGVLGYRYALESVINENDGCQVFDESMPHPLREPTYYNGPLNRRLLEKAIAFGDALITESFTVLGADANDWVEEFKSAENDEDQIGALMKLHDRLKELGRSTKGMEEIEAPRSVFHSIRISPKAVGSFPDHNFPPTCLGIAAIGAGFLKKAGAEFMHGGVMQMARHSQYLDLVELAMLAVKPQIEGSIGTTVPSDIVDRLDKKIQEVMDVLFDDSGTHSALMVRLTSGTWFQFDPNLDASTQLDPSLDDGPGVSSQVLDWAYKDLTGSRDLAPGLELTVTLSDYISVSSIWPLHLEKLGPIEEKDIDELFSSDAEVSVESIRQLIVDRYLFRDLDENPVDFIKELFFENYVTEDEGGAEELSINNVSKRAIKQFVIDGDSVDGLAEKYRNDEETRQSIVQRIKCLPLLIGFMYGNELANGTPIDYTHPRLEVGLPEASIGLAALHNIGLDVAEDLSAHFWLAQWPSHIVPPDVVSKKSKSPGQNAVITRHLERLINDRSMGFIHAYAKIVGSYKDNDRDFASINNPSEVQDGRKD